MIAAFALGEVAVQNCQAGPVATAIAGRLKTTLLVVAGPGEAQLHVLRRASRQQRNAVVAFLPIVVDELVAELLNCLHGELLVTDFGFLQRDDLRRVTLGDGLELVQPGANAVGVEGDDAHGRSSSQLLLPWGPGGAQSSLNSKHKANGFRCSLRTLDRAPNILKNITNCSRDSARALHVGYGPGGRAWLDSGATRWGTRPFAGACGR